MVNRHPQGVDNMIFNYMRAKSTPSTVNLIKFGFHFLNICNFAFQGKEEFIQKLQKEKSIRASHSLDMETATSTTTTTTANKKDTSSPPPESSNAITADEMSVYYAEFLNRKWSSHLKFNIEWQKRNISIVILSVLVGLENIVNRRKK